ncbi:hypothetical protein, partial [Listeria booriae]|uniref:hypothetical protein n=2 Tax=Listeria TaxID=1637 RepID=UPI001C8906F8
DSIFQKDSLQIKEGMMPYEVYEYDRVHSLEEALDMRLETIAGLNELDYPGVEPVRELLEATIRYRTEDEKETYLQQEKQLLREKVEEFKMENKTNSLSHYILDEYHGFS